MGSFVVLVRSDRLAIVLPIGHAGMFGVRSGVFGPDKFISVVSSVTPSVAASSFSS